MAVYVAYADRRFVYVAEQIVGQGLSLAAVGHHYALLEQNDALHFRRDLVEMMSDDDDILALIGQAADLPQIVKTGRNVQSGRRLVHYQRCRLVYQGAGQQAASLLAGRHKFELCIDKLRHTQRGENFAGSIDMLGAYAIGQQAMDPDAGLKPGHNHGQGSCCWRVAIVQIVRYGANFFAQFPNVPTIATEYAHPRVVFNNRVQLSIDRFQQRSFSGSVWAQNGDSLLLRNHQV